MQTAVQSDISGCCEINSLVVAPISQPCTVALEWREEGRTRIRTAIFLVESPDGCGPEIPRAMGSGSYPEWPPASITADYLLLLRIPTVDHTASGVSTFSPTRSPSPLCVAKPKAGGSSLVLSI